jgi:hypothetical protein
MLESVMIAICVVGVVFFGIVIGGLFREMKRHKHK